MRHAKLVGAVSNPDLPGSRLSRCNRGESGQADSVRLKTAPTGHGENAERASSHSNNPPDLGSEKQSPRHKSSSVAKQAVPLS